MTCNRIFAGQGWLAPAWFAFALGFCATALPAGLHAQAKESAPVLLVESYPAGAQVFVDEVPMGHTIPQGRLKLSTLRPGLHRVRIALPGYRDYQHDIQLGRDQVVPLIVQLVKRQAGREASTTAGKSDSATPTKPSAAGGPDTVNEGVLRGLRVLELTPGRRHALGLSAKTQGVVIVEVKADSPAGASGLKRDDVIETINRRPIRSPAQFRHLAADAGGDVALRVNRRGQTKVVVVSESE